MVVTNVYKPYIHTISMITETTELKVNSFKDWLIFIKDFFIVSPFEDLRKLREKVADEYNKPRFLYTLFWITIFVLIVIDLRYTFKITKTLILTNLILLFIVALWREKRAGGYRFRWKQKKDNQ